MASQTKFIFITGGVTSSLGKGIVASGLGTLLTQRGITTTIMKLDPYLNVDPGTMNPFQHGEVFVTEDGAETDLDLGHYERFLDSPTSRANSVTAGQVYEAILTKERRGDFLGATVQVIPHVTDEIKARIYSLARKTKAQIVIVEVGGTVGDIESLPFLEAIRQISFEVGRESCLYLHVTLLPYLENAGELKTKPTQHSVKALREIGIQPDGLVCRTPVAIEASPRRKIAMFCNVSESSVFESRNVDVIYEVPLMLHAQGFDKWVVEKLGVVGQDPDLSEWEDLLDRIDHSIQTLRIGVVGKYIDLQDAYISIYESLHHAAIAHKVRLNIVRIDSEALEKGEGTEELESVDGILIPGGFGSRGVEGKIAASDFARRKKIPYFGICLGMQVALIGFARHVCHLYEANSTEFSEKTPDPVVDLMMSQKSVLDLGGTMRLGHYPMKIKAGTKAAEVYGQEEAYERHRHRYEVNNEYRQLFEDNGMILSGTFEETELVEMIELKDHPWFVGCQFHPEFQSRPLRPHPLFQGFISAVVERVHNKSEKKTADA